MADIGINGLTTKSANDINNLVVMFIKSSLNVRTGIINGDDPDVCMLTLIRDTYTCNILLRYVGLMTLVSSDNEWINIDNKLMNYVQEYHNNSKFKNKLIDLNEHYLNKYEKDRTNYDYCKFLEKLINRCDMSKKSLELKNTIRMLENRILNLLSVNPIIKIATRHFRETPTQYEIKQDKVIVALTYTNFCDLMNKIDDIDIRHQIEKQYVSRTNNVMTDFSKLVMTRKLLAETTINANQNKTSIEEDANRSSSTPQSKSKPKSETALKSTYFKYINRGKYDNTETIKGFITDINTKIDKKTHDELSKIHQYYQRINKDKQNKKISKCDVMRYVNIHGNNTKFEPKHVFRIIFELIDKFFNIKLVQLDTKIAKVWRSNVLAYTVLDKTSGKMLGRFFMDVVFDENKKITNPLSIRLSDKMQINTDSRTTSEVALLANYTSSKCMYYKDVVILFREFGYVINNICYESRVGLINYDEEFSNYLPSLMECIAWDRNTIRMIVGTMDHSIIDHIEHSRELDFCYNLKLKCINASFDHLIHNSEPLLEIISEAFDKKNDASKEIVETYVNSFTHVMEPLANIYETNIEYVDPLTLIQEMNGIQGLLYSNLMNEVFAYATFWIMKDRNNTEFRECVLNNGVDSYRELIKTYLKKVNIDCFSLYLKNVAKIDMSDDCATEDNNCFEESDQDKEEIIQIQRT
jgi:hypothetical protein